MTVKGGAILKRAPSNKNADQHTVGRQAADLTAVAVPHLGAMLALRLVRKVQKDQAAEMVPPGALSNSGNFYWPGL